MKHESIDPTDEAPWADICGENALHDYVDDDYISNQQVVQAALRFGDTQASRMRIEMALKGTTQVAIGQTIARPEGDA